MDTCKVTNIYQAAHLFYKMWIEDGIPPEEIKRMVSAEKIAGGKLMWKFPDPEKQEARLEDYRRAVPETLVLGVSATEPFGVDEIWWRLFELEQPEAVS